MNHWFTSLQKPTTGTIITFFIRFHSTIKFFTHTLRTIFSLNTFTSLPIPIPIQHQHIACHGFPQTPHHFPAFSHFLLFILSISSRLPTHSKARAHTHSKAHAKARTHTHPEAHATHPKAQLPSSSICITNLP